MNISTRKAEWPQGSQYCYLYTVYRMYEYIYTIYKLSKRMIMNTRPGKQSGHRGASTVLVFISNVYEYIQPFHKDDYEYQYQESTERPQAILLMEKLAIG